MTYVALLAPTASQPCYLGVTDQVVPNPPVAYLAYLEGLIGRIFVGARANSDLTKATPTNALAQRYDGTNTETPASARFTYQDADWTTSDSLSVKYFLNRTVNNGTPSIAGGGYDGAQAGGAPSPAGGGGVTVAWPGIDARLLGIKASDRWDAANPYHYSPQHEQLVNTAQQPRPTASTGLQDFIDAYRHIRDRADALGVTVKTKAGAANGGNVVFCFVPNTNQWQGPTAGDSVDAQGIDWQPANCDPDGGSSPAPGGTSYYELGGVDLYNKLDNAPASPTYGYLMDGVDPAPIVQTIQAYMAAKGKQWLIGEMGCEDNGTVNAAQNHIDKATWIHNLRRALKACGAGTAGSCLALLCTSSQTGNDTRIDSSAQALAEFRELANDPWFTAGLPLKLGGSRGTVVDAPISSLGDSPSGSVRDAPGGSVVG